MNNFIEVTKRLLRKNRKPVLGIIFTIVIFLILPILVFLKVVFRRTIVTCRINARYFGHLGFNAAIASAHSSNKEFFVLASFIQPVVNTKLKEAAENSLYMVNDQVLKLFEKVYYALPDVINRIIVKFIRPIIDDRNELRELSHFNKLARDEDDWKKAFWSSVNRSQGKQNTGILVALRTSDFHGNSATQMLESYRNMNPHEVACVLEAALNNSQQIPVTFYGSRNLFERHIENSLTFHKVKFIDQARVDVLDLFPSAELIINNGNGIGSVAAVANARVLHIKHSPWQAWPTFHKMGLIFPALYSSPETSSCSLEDLCKIALNTATALPFDYHENFLSRYIILKPINSNDTKIIASSIEEALSSNNFEKMNEIHNGISFDYSSELERVFWRAYIDHMPEKLRSVHCDIRIKISSSFLSNYFSA